jgi:hypothetical protein
MILPVAGRADEAQLVVPNPSFDRQAPSNIVTLSLSTEDPRAAGHFELFYDPERLDPVTVELADGLGSEFAVSWSAIGDGVTRVVVSDPSASGLTLPTGSVPLLDIDFEVVEARWYLETEIAFRGGVTVRSATDDSTTTVPAGDPIEIDLLDSTLTGAPPDRVSRLALHQCRPNPFNPRTEIRFETPSAGRATLRIYDVAGRLVRTLVNEDLEPGSHQRVWDGTDQRGGRVGSGVYLYRLEFGNRSATKKLTLIK